jgi:protoporphyrin/coproporphyrin ferrochelatase
MARVGILLMQMGGPRRLEEVQPYIQRLFADRNLVRLPAPISWFQKPLSYWVARRRAPVVRRQYASIGGGSPNNRVTIEQAAALQRCLRQETDEGTAQTPERNSGHQYFCYAAMTYTPPSVQDALRAARADGCERFLAVSLFPHFSSASTGVSLCDLHKACETAEIGPDRVQTIERWGVEPMYLEALAQRCRQSLKIARQAHPQAPVLLVSAHGIPESYVRRGDPYVQEIQASVAGLMRNLPKDQQYRLSFQSRATPVKWVQPATDQTLQKLGQAGQKNLVILPISFVNDHIETLYEIDQLLADIAQRAGVEHYQRVPAFNTDSDLIDILKKLVLKHETRL